MSYNIQLYRKEVKNKELQYNDDNFFEKDENRIPFTDEQKEYLIARLLKYGYSVDRSDQYGVHLSFKDDNGINVLLSDSALYFSAAGEGIFEICMTASEFTDTGEFSKYDPQEGGWEEV